DDTVLEHRLSKVDDVVDEDIRPIGPEREDIVGETGLPTIGRGEGQRCRGRDIEDDLEHGAPLVDVAAAIQTLLDHLDGREVSGRDVRWRSSLAVEAVGEHA